MLGLLYDLALEEWQYSRQGLPAWLISPEQICETTVTKVMSLRNSFEGVNARKERKIKPC